MASRTGDVAWLDSYGRLYLNDRELGRANQFVVAGWTGDVAWLDSWLRYREEFYAPLLALFVVTSLAPYFRGRPAATSARGS